jgi:hypothetical protein
MDRSGLRRLFSFPDPVNETSSRVVATGVVIMGALFLLTGWSWLLAVLVYGFLSRVLTGPSLSPLGQLATRVVTPRLRGPHRSVPGPPKRFAQVIGLTFTAAASVAWLVGAPGVAQLLIVGLIAGAALEAAFAVCLGCIVYNRIWGCADCDDIRLRVGEPALSD